MDVSGTSGTLVTLTEQEALSLIFFCILSEVPLCQRERRRTASHSGETETFGGSAQAEEGDGGQSSE